MLGVLWLFIAVVLVRFRSQLLPFGLAVLLAFIIEPAVTWLNTKELRGRPISRVSAVLSLYAVIAVIAYVATALTLPQFGREIAKIGDERTQMIRNVKKFSNTAVERIESLANKNNIAFDRQEFTQAVGRNIENLSQEITSNAAKLLTAGKNFVAGIFVAVFGSFLVLMLTAFISIDKTRIEDFAVSLVPPEYYDSYESIAAEISRGLAGVVRGQVMICLTNGVLTLVGLLILGVRFPFLLGTLAAVFSLIPIFGSIISTIPIVLIALTQSLTLAILSLLWIIGIHLVEANFLNPKIMGDAAKIHPVIVVFVLVVGETTAGLMGALFAVPIASVALTFFKFIHARALQDVPKRSVSRVEHKG